MNKHVFFLLVSSVFYHCTSLSESKYIVFHELRFISVFKEMHDCPRHINIGNVCRLHHRTQVLIESYKLHPRRGTRQGSCLSWRNRLPQCLNQEIRYSRFDLTRG